MAWSVVGVMLCPLIEEPLIPEGSKSPRSSLNINSDIKSVTKLGGRGGGYWVCFKFKFNSIKKTLLDVRNRQDLP